MEKLILDLCPSLLGQTELLAIITSLFYMFFGSIFFAFIRGLFEWK